MALSADEFLEIKDTYVDQVLDRLRLLARQEAELLFHESALQPDLALPQLSERISYAILRASDALGEQLDDFPDAQKQRLWPLLREQVPAVLFERYSQRLPERLPWEYIKNMLSSGLAGRCVDWTRCSPLARQQPFVLTPLRAWQPYLPIALDDVLHVRAPSPHVHPPPRIGRLVYREGLQFVESTPDARLRTISLAYLQQEQQVRALAAEVARSNLASAEAVESLLLRGGVRAAVDQQLAKGN